MKKLLLVFMAFLTVTALFADVGPVGRSATEDATGAFAGPAEKWFINVKNTSGGALVAGNVVILDATEVDGFSVNTTSTAGQTGHCVLAVACADDEVCSCQTYGLASIVYDATGDNAVVGQPVFVSEANAGQAYGITTPDALDRPLGLFMEASAVSGSVSAFLKMR